MENVMEGPIVTFVKFYVNYASSYVRNTSTQESKAKQEFSAILWKKKKPGKQISIRIPKKLTNSQSPPFIH